MVVPAYIPTSSVGVPLSPHPLQQLLRVDFEHGRSDWCEVRFLPAVLIRVCLIVTIVERRLVCLLASCMASFLLFLFMVLFRRILLHWVSFQSNYQFCSLEAIAPGWAWPRKAKSVFVFGLLIRLEELFIKHLLTKIIALLLKPTLRNVLSESSAYTENPSVSCG